jgi:excisionase family DNA binding protein
MSSYNLEELDDRQPPQGRDIKYLAGLLERVLAENEEIKNELINLNTPFPIMTKEEAANFLKVSERTVTNWSNQGIIPTYELGDKSVRFKRKDLEACLKRRDGKIWDPKQFKL